MRLRVLTFNAWALPWPLSHQPHARMEAVGDRLASLNADVVAFHCLGGTDEEGTIVRFGALREKPIDPSVAEHSGRWHPPCRRLVAQAERRVGHRKEM